MLHLSPTTLRASNLFSADISPSQKFFLPFISFPFTHSTLMFYCVSASDICNIFWFHIHICKILIVFTVVLLSDDTGVTDQSFFSF